MQPGLEDLFNLRLQGNGAVFIRDHVPSHYFEGSMWRVLAEGARPVKQRCARAGAV